MHFTISTEQFQFLVDELERSHKSLQGHVTTLVLADKNEKAKEYAERAVKMSALIYDIKQTASQV